MTTYHLLITTGLLLGGASPLLAATSEPVPSPDQPRHVIVQRTTEAHGEGGHAIDVRVEDGKTTVRVDGREITADRIRHEDGRIIILDEDGEPMEHVGSIWVTDGSEPSIMHLGDGAAFATVGPHALKLAPRPDAPPPPVMLGISMSEPGAALRSHLGLEAGTATLVTSVYEGLPAHAGGLREHDVVTGIDGAEGAEPDAIRAALMERGDGDCLRLSIIRAGAPETVTVPLREYDGQLMHEALLRSQGGLARVRVLTDRGEGEAEAEVFFAPDENTIFERAPNVRWNDIDKRVHELIRERMPQMEELERRLHERIQRMNEDQGPGARLDALSEILGDLERVLDRLLDRIESQP